MSEPTDSWNWVCWTHLLICLMLAALAGVTFVVHSLNGRWNRFDHA